MPKRKNFSRSRSRGRLRLRGSGLASGIAAGANFMHSFMSSRTRQKNLQSYPRPITGQRDQSQLYRRKRMPFRRRKRWVQFKRRVNAVIEKRTGVKFTVLVNTQNATSSANKQGYTNIHTIMGLNGTATSTNDVSILLDYAVIGGLITSKTAGKIVITGCLCETQVHNVGLEDAWLDCYYWRSKKQVPTSLGDFGAVWVDALVDTIGLFPVGGSALDPNDYGATPFQGVQLAKTVRVFKKTRTLLTPGGVVQVETRSGKNYPRTWSFDEEYSMDRCTEGVFFVFYGVPTAVATIAEGVNLRFTTNKNYSWHIVQDARLHAGTNLA